MFCTHTGSLIRQAPGWLVGQLTGKGRREIILLRHRDALGDTLMVTALTRSLKKWDASLRVSVVARRSDIFYNNPYIDEIRDWHLWRTRGTVQASYKREQLAHPGHAVEFQWQSLFKELHATDFFDSKDLPKGDVPPLSDLQPELFLTESECTQGKILAGKTDQDPRPLILISSGGKLKPTHNREWGHSNYQALVDALAPHARLIQVGGEETLKANGEALPDFGRMPIRKAAALFKYCDALLVQEGGLMHLARAVDAPTVVIYGGYVLPEQTGYMDQVNLWKKPACSPCIVAPENCAHLKCMIDISPRKVLTCMAKLIEERSGYKLPAEALEKAPATWTPPEFVDQAILKKELEQEAKMEGTGN